MLPETALNDDMPTRTIRSTVTKLDVERSFRAAFANAPDGVTFKKTRKRLVRQALETIQTYGLDTSKSSTEPARWLICLSGGKDSYALLSILLELKYLGAIQAELLACNLDHVADGHHLLAAVAPLQGHAGRLDRPGGAEVDHGLRP